MFQDGVSSDNQSHFMNTDWIEDDGLLLTVPELTVLDETGLSQFTLETSSLQYEPLFDPQIDASTIL
ncbi:Ff.00g112410.m01.CDS01 [Fusarium sp. VM40]|nr:Ff.00g112410.m01.CDS01 [Fusarium sp. VM40]